MLRRVFKPSLAPLRTPLAASKRLYASDAVIGIDLGTTNSCVSILEGDKPIVLENDGKRQIFRFGPLSLSEFKAWLFPSTCPSLQTTPSIFAIDFKNKTRLVGSPAQRQMVINSKNTFYATKRLIGRRFTDAEIKKLSDVVSFKIVPSPKGDAWVADETGKAYSPSQIASEILMRLKKVAEEYLGDTVSRAVITVPAYFDNHQRQATEDAGRIAGLKVERIINEPTAAALAYGISREEDKTVVVYDLGGGTFDVSILQMGQGVFEVKSTSGDTFLGGEDFNDVIIKHVLAEFKKKEGVDLSEDKIALQRIREASENSKHILSSRETASITLPYIKVDKAGKTLNLDMELTRAKFEELSASLIERSITPCKTALKDAGLTIDEVTDVILVGGMTRMPKVRETVKKFFKKEPFIGVNPDEAVAVGAALQGAIIANQGIIPGAEQRELVLLDVTPLNLGIEVQSGELAVIIPAQTSIPCKKTHTFTTVSDFQTEMSTKVYQGNRPIAKANRLLGEYVVRGIPPAPKGVAKIDVTFTCSANGIISATSRDRAAGVEQGITINMAGGLSSDEIEKMRKEAELNAAADVARQETFRARETARASIAKIEEGLKANTGAIPEETRKQIVALIGEVNAAIESGDDKKTLQEKITQLEALSGKAFTDAYNSRAKTSS